MAMDVLHWVFLIMWLFTGFTLTPFTGLYFYLLLKLKGGAPGTRGVHVTMIESNNERIFWAAWLKGMWQGSTGAAGEFVVTEKTGTVLTGKGFPHTLRKDDTFIREGRKDTVIITGLSHMNLEFQKKYNVQKLENLKLKSELSKTKMQLHEAQTQINKRGLSLNDKTVMNQSKLIPQAKQKTTK